MYFAATDNLAIIGYDYRLVSFDSKKKRDMFVENEPMYKAISVKDLNSKFEEKTVKALRTYKDSILDLGGKLHGMVFFTIDGDYYGIE